MHLILTEGMKWVPSPHLHPPGQTREDNDIKGVYLGPDENVEWFSISDPKTNLSKVVGYAIRKNRFPAKRKSYLICVK